MDIVEIMYNSLIGISTLFSWSRSVWYRGSLGKLITSVVTGIAHRRPQGESYDQAIRNDETGLWQCPFCQQDNFPELSEVRIIYAPYSAAIYTDSQSEEWCVMGFKFLDLYLLLYLYWPQLSF